MRTAKLSSATIGARLELLNLSTAGLAVQQGSGRTKVAPPSGAEGPRRSQERVEQTLWRAILRQCLDVPSAAARQR